MWKLRVQMYFTDHLKGTTKLPRVYWRQSHALTEITNTNAKNGTILLIKDFSSALHRSLQENYSKVVLVDLRYYKGKACQTLGNTTWTGCCALRNWQPCNRYGYRMAQVSSLIFNWIKSGCCWWIDFRQVTAVFCNSLIRYIPHSL